MTKAEKFLNEIMKTIPDDPKFHQYARATYEMFGLPCDFSYSVDMERECLLCGPWITVIEYIEHSVGLSEFGEMRKAIRDILEENGNGKS